MNVPSAPDPAPLGAPPRAAPPVADLGLAIAISGVVGVIFLMIGADFGHWLAATVSHQPYPTGTNWTDGPLAGQPVDYFDLTGGSAWRDMGQFATGVALLLEAALYTLVLLRPPLARPLIFAVLVVAVLGCVANAVSAGMQIKAGFDQPIFALVGLVLCIISAVNAKNTLR